MIVYYIIIMLVINNFPINDSEPNNCVHALYIFAKNHGFNVSHTAIDASCLLPVPHCPGVFMSQLGK